MIRPFLIYAGILACGWASAMDPPDLSAYLADEEIRDRLRAGELVRWDKSPGGERIYFDEVFRRERIKQRGGVLFLFAVDLDPDTVWDVLRDAESHPEIYSRLKSAEVTLSMLYRDVSDSDNPHGGPMFVAARAFEQHRDDQPDDREHDGHQR